MTDKFTEYKKLAENQTQANFEQFSRQSRRLAPELVRLVELAEGALRQSNATLRHYEILDGGHEAYCQRVENNQALAEIERVRGNK